MKVSCYIITKHDYNKLLAMILINCTHASNKTFNSSALNSSLQSLVQISNNILYILQPYADPDQVVSHTKGHPLLLLNGGVSHQVRQLCQALITSQRFSQGDELEYDLRNLNPNQ